MALPCLHSARVRVTEHLASAVAGPSRGFQTTSVALESKARANARRKRQKVLLGRAATAEAAVAERSHPVLGSPLNSPSGPSALYEGSRLQKVVLRAQDVWYSAPPDYAAGQEPTHYLPGLSAADRELLFGAVPHASTALAFDPERPAASDAAAADQAQQSETLRRILDLRNASKAGIEVVNRQRIVDEFGTAPNDTGSAPVQAALITHKIRSLWDHIETNKRDTQNRRALRLLVHKRARVLKYFKSQDEDAYDALLADLGLTRSAVEGEILVGM